MSRRTPIGSLRAAELVLSAVFLVLPGRLHWSRNSAAVLASAGLALAGSGVTLGPPRGQLGSVLRAFSHNRAAIVGSALFAIQYLLTEEESAVRGTIAGIGAALLAAGVAVRWATTRTSTEVVT